MTQENTLATQVEASSSDSQVETTEVKEPEVDWKARFDEESAARQKVENDLRAERGRRTRDQAFQELTEDVGGLKQLVTAIANRTASGEQEALVEDISAINKQTEAQQTSRAWTVNYSEAEASLADVLMGEDNTLLISQDDVSALTPLWQEARQKQDLHGLYRVVSQAGKMVRAAERARAREEVKKVEADAQAHKKESDAKHGINDLSISPPAGVGAADNLSPSERIEKGLKEHRDGTKPSAVFG